MIVLGRGDREAACRACAVGHPSSRAAPKSRVIFAHSGKQAALEETVAMRARKAPARRPLTCQRHLLQCVESLGLDERSREVERRLAVVMEYAGNVPEFQADACLPTTPSGARDRSPLGTRPAGRQATSPVCSQSSPQ